CCDYNPDIRLSMNNRIIPDPGTNSRYENENKNENCNDKNADFENVNERIQKMNQNCSRN
ncbi:1488_t:CDS:1, partial [Ambispora leptoticha]